MHTILHCTLRERAKAAQGFARAPRARTHLGNKVHRGEMGRRAGSKNVNSGLDRGFGAGRAKKSYEDGNPRLDTIIAQAGGIGLGLCPGQGANHGDTTGSIIPPIYPSTTYSRDIDTYQTR